MESFALTALMNSIFKLKNALKHHQKKFIILMFMLMSLLKKIKLHIQMLLICYNLQQMVPRPVLLLVVIHLFLKTHVLSIDLFTMVFHALFVQNLILSLILPQKNVFNAIILDIMINSLVNASKGQ